MQLSKFRHIAVRRMLFIAGFSLASFQAQSAIIYKCRALNGAHFWSSSVCTGHNAIYVGSSTVPDKMSFEQQVATAEAAERLNPKIQQVPAGIGPTESQVKARHCKYIDEEITAITRRQREPLTAYEQDQLSARKRAASARYAELGC
jgi:hypothetical protein